MIPLLIAIENKFNAALVPTVFSQQLYGANMPSIDSASGSTGSTSLVYPYCRYIQVPGKPIQRAFGNRDIENPVVQFDVFHNDSAGALFGVESICSNGVILIGVTTNPASAGTYNYSGTTYNGLPVYNCAATSLYIWYNSSWFISSNPAGPGPGTNFFSSATLTGTYAAGGPLASGSPVATKHNIFDYAILPLYDGAMLSMLRQKEPVCVYEGKDQNSDDVWHAWIRYDISVQIS